MLNMRMTFGICLRFSLGCMVHSANITRKEESGCLVYQNDGSCWESRSQWLHDIRCGSAVARLLGLWVRIPPGAWMFVYCECCVLSGRGFCVGLITRREEYYRLRCVAECDRESLIMRRPWPTRAVASWEKKLSKNILLLMHMNTWNGNPGTMLNIKNMRFWNKLPQPPCCNNRISSFTD
jgi:hypothetical protein